jgi:ligand-binding sensor domain-containing protein
MINTKMIINTIIYKRIPYFALFTVLVLFSSCNTQNKTGNTNSSANEQKTVTKEDTSIKTMAADTAATIGRDISSIFQDRNDNYWFGTQDMGVYLYDGKTLIQFTRKNGLYSNQVLTIQEDKSGNIWIGTGGFGVNRFDGRTFTTFSSIESNNSDKDWKIGPEDLWFYAGGGAYRFTGNSLTYLPLPKTDFDSDYSLSPADRLGPYGVYCTLKDQKGNMWFGTQTMGVCRYDGKSFTWITGKGLSGPAIRGLFEDKNGNLWFGNNGNGLFRYDGKSLINLTEEKGLSNHEFIVTGKFGPGTLARVWTINEDNNGNLWVGTIDAGVWQYDGKNLINYTTKDGLTSNTVNVIYKDKKGELWFGTGGTGVCIFNGVSFTQFAFNRNS